MRSLILKCLTAGLVTILPSHSTQAEPKSRDQHPLQPCSSVRFQPQQLQRLSPRGCVDTEFPDGSLIVIQYGRPNSETPTMVVRVKFSDSGFPTVRSGEQARTRQHHWSRIRT